jgi:hypothetical protein
MKTMSSRRHVLAVGMIVALAVSSWGEEAQTNATLRLAIDLVDGSRLIGTPAIATVPVQTAYAKMDVPLAQIQSLKIGDDHETVTLDLLNGDKLTGVISLKPIELKTVFGTVAVGIEQIQQLDIVLSGGTGQKGLVLWNRLGSESEVKNSRVGLGGKLNAGRFVEGRFGKGIELNMQEQFGVTFPSEIVSGPDGCIEFWAKLVNFPGDIRQPGGAWPSLIAGVDDKGPVGFLMHFCANDGGSAGGLCFQVAGNGGTGRYGSWPYAKALGAGTAEGWHHYALVWAGDGIPGVDNGKRRTAIFVDGKLNTGFWNGEGGSLTIPKTARFGLLAHQGTPSGSVVFDNLKIWSYAKTDFNDRDRE